MSGRGERPELADLRSNGRRATGYRRQRSRTQQGLALRLDRGTASAARRRSAGEWRAVSAPSGWAGPACAALAAEVGRLLRTLVAGPGR